MNPDLPQDDRPIEEILTEMVEGFNRIIEICGSLSKATGEMIKKPEEEGGESKEWAHIKQNHTLLATLE